MRLGFLSFNYLQNRKIQNEELFWYEVISLVSYTTLIQTISRSVSIKRSTRKTRAEMQLDPHSKRSLRLSEQNQEWNCIGNVRSIVQY